jgi:Zn-dependent membrane protease YugP
MINASFLLSKINRRVPLESFVDENGNINVSDYLESNSSTTERFGSFSEILDAIESHWFTILIIAIVASVLIQFSAKIVFHIYSHKFSKRMLSGEEAAKAMLIANCVYGVDVVGVSGELTDHYDPEVNEIRLSEKVYNNSSVAAVGIACHEAGHAIQDAYGSPMIKVRNVLCGLTDLSWEASLIISAIGLFLGIYDFVYFLTYATIIIYLVSTAFKLISLPVEFDASLKALKSMKKANILDEEEIVLARRVLVACAMTYVASAIVTVLYLLKLIASARNKNR